MKNNLSLIGFLVYLCLLCSLGSVEAKTNIEKQQRNIGNWITYIEKKGKQKICYTYSTPIKTMSYMGERSTPYVNINYLGINKFSITAYAGYDLSKQHPVIMTIDQDKKHSLNNSYENYAATYNSDQDNYLINLLIKTTIDYFSIKSYDNDKNFALDYYSLSGFKESLQYLKNHCT